MRKGTLAKKFKIDTFFVKNDLIAGITVALLLVPQSLAHATLAGLPPQYGLYAALLPPVIAALFGSCPQLATGPAALMSIMTLAAITPLAAPGTQEYITYAVLLAFVMGVILLITGVFKLGYFSNFLSHPVIYGFTNAAALVIVATQLSAFFGITVQNQDRLYKTVIEVINKAQQGTNFNTLYFGIAIFGFMYMLRKIDKKVPYVLIALILSTLFTWVTRYQTPIVGQIPSGFTPLSKVEVNAKVLETLVESAAIMALIGFTEAISVAEVIALKTKQKFNPNKELVGQGLANIIGALGNSYPTSGSLSRTAINFDAGAKSWLSSLFTSLTVLVSIVFFTDLIYYLPKVALSAVILISIVGLFDFKKIVVMWHINRYDAWAAIITFITTLYFAPELEKGVIIGVFFSVGYFFYKNTKPKVAFLSLYKDKHLHNAEAFHLDVCENIAVVRLDAPLFFANAQFFEDEVTRYLESHKKITDILFVGTGINEIDATGEDLLEELVNHLKQAKKRIYFSALKNPVLATIKESGFYNKVGGKNFYATTSQALGHITSNLEKLHLHTDKEHCPLEHYTKVDVESMTAKKISRNRTAYYYEKLTNYLK
ncbi:MAG: SulP family inorganic anion transporter [Patescibacteria group bacterium]